MELTWVRRLSHVVLPVVWRIVLKFDAQGHHFVPKEGPLIVTANHVNIIDPFLVDENVGRVMIYFVKEELHTHPLIGFLARRNMTIPVRRGEVDPSAVKAALRVLRDGLALYVAPEGTRSGTGFLGQGHDGAVVLALRTGAAVVPCAIWGHAPVFSNLKRLRRTPVSLRFGPAYRFVGPSRPSKDEVAAMTDEMMYRIATLMPPEWRGVYAGDPPPYRYTVDVRAGSPEALPAVSIS